ncbi:MAG TPA: hypothetical protein PKK50_06450 [Myxococcota bacterium]|nr:hypothetical protein [Myxococcota bacterium]
MRTASLMTALLISATALACTGRIETTAPSGDGDPFVLLTGRFGFEDAGRILQDDAGAALTGAGQPGWLEVKNDLASGSNQMYDQLVHLFSGIFRVDSAADGGGELAGIFSKTGGWGTIQDEFDAAVVKASWIPEFVAAGWLASLGSGTPDTELGSALREAEVSPVMVDGQVFGVPLTRNPEVVLLRNDCLKAARESDQTVTPDVLWTRTISAWLDDPASVPDRWIVCDGQDVHRLFLAIVRTREPLWPIDSNGKLLVDTETARAAIEMLKKADGPFRGDDDFLSGSQNRQMSRRLVQGFLADAPETPGSCWLYSNEVPRLLFGPRSISTTCGGLDRVSFARLLEGSESSGCEDGDGLALVIPYSLEVTGKTGPTKHARAVRLAVDMLSSTVQKALFIEQFQLPARTGVLNECSDTDIINQINIVAPGLIPRGQNTPGTCSPESLLDAIRRLSALTGAPGQTCDVSSDVFRHSCFRLDEATRRTVEGFLVDVLTGRKTTDQSLSGLQTALGRSCVAGPHDGTEATR